MIAARRSSFLVELALASPLFVFYHFGLLFLDSVKNATDFVSPYLFQLTSYNKGLYLLATVGVALLVIGAAAWSEHARRKRLPSATRSQSDGTALMSSGFANTFGAKRFVWVLVEGTLFAAALRFLGALITRTLVGAGLQGSSGIGSGLVLSAGAGFYEELSFRVVLFGLGLWALQKWISPKNTVQPVLARSARALTSAKRAPLAIVWGLFSAFLFSAIHYVGPFRDALELNSFVFRMVLGILLTLLFVFRGFATAAWAHALYDMWFTLTH
ncbi:MAG: CPBP family intramembrane metalloprotease [Polyangiaceae bacterium]|nr:CPBP family intramembrane metalloprotease [Polyangiaceae bacterium]